MSAVIANSGQPEASCRPVTVPRDKWRMLMWVKRDFIKTRIKHDCRSLLEFIQDAGIMWEELGFESADDMIRNGYELNPNEVILALEWLRIKDPDEAVKYDVAVAGGRKLLTRAEAGAEGGRGNKAVDNIKSFQGGTQADYLLARLARDYPEILNGYERGDYPSVRQAAIAAGIVKVPTPLEHAKKAVMKLDGDDRQELLTWLTHSGAK